MITMASLIYRLWQHHVFFRLLLSLIVPTVALTANLLKVDRSILFSFTLISFVFAHAGLLHLHKPQMRRPYIYYAGVFLAGLLSSVIGNWIPLFQVIPSLLIVGFCVYLGVIIWPMLGRNLMYLFSVVLWGIVAILHAGQVIFNSSWVITDWLFVVGSFFVFCTMFNRFTEMMLHMTRSSFVDPLTGLYNRRYFTRQVIKAVEEGTPISVIFCDLDNFKSLNDTQGHEAGDATLRHVARILLEESEGVGIAGRYGGEEMVVLITEPSADPADIAERIRARVESETAITLSIGYARFVQGMTADAVIKCADEAMYAAKNSGKNQVVGWDEKLNVIATQR